MEIAHRDGCLTQASLMVAGDAAADAVARARRLPGLKTGLHLVLVEGASVSGHERLSHITQADGWFGSEQARLGVKYFFSPAARRELEIEIRAQFEAYRATGLYLHHADCHKHMHLHPTVAALMIRVGREFGLRRIRVPAEPPAVLAACGTPARMGDLMLYRWSSLLRRQARRAGLATSDHVFGIRWSGQMTGARIARLLANLPPGSSEIYFHPATRQDGELARLMPDYRHREELDALLSVST